MNLPEGWFGYHDQLDLAKAVRSAPVGQILEVGVFKGRSAWILKKNMWESQRLILCDNFKLGDFRDQWPEADRIVEGDPVGQFDFDDFSLVHHDGPHDYDGVHRHLLYLVPRIVVGGYLAVHDYHGTAHPEVRTATDDALREIRGFKGVPRQGPAALAVFWRETWDAS